MGIINGIDVASRELVWIDDPAQIKKFNTEVRSTAPKIVQRFLADFEGSDENMNVILAAARTISTSKYVTVSMFVAGMEAAMNRAPSLERWAPGKLKRKPAAPVVASTPEPEVPLDRNGRPLTQAQIKWSEYQKFLNEASSAQIAERRRNDAGFRSFIQHNLRDQMHQEIDGAVVAEEDIRPNAPRSLSDQERDRLMSFAQEFNALPARVARQKMLSAFNPAWESYVADFEKCRALRLL